VDRPSPRASLYAGDLSYGLVGITSTQRFFDLVLNCFKSQSLTGNTSGTMPVPGEAGGLLSI
jgi:hypothetical protein